MKVSYEHEPNCVISFEDRLEILYLYKAHQISACEIAGILGYKSSTIRSIILTYNKYGRINKLLTHSAKKILLEGRAHRATLLKPKLPTQCPSSIRFITLVDDEGNEKLSIKNKNFIDSNFKMA